MSLAAFQQAFAALAASPALVAATRRDPASALAGFDLTAREQRRLAHVAGQRGIAAQCSMYRITRLTALNSLLPLTLAALGPGLRPLVDAYWADNPVHEVRFAAEARRFLDFLDAHPDLLAAAAGAAAAALRDLAALELAVEEVRLATPATGAPLAVSLGLAFPAAALLAAAPAGRDALAAVAPAAETLMIVARPGEAPELFGTRATA